MFKHDAAKALANQKSNPFMVNRSIVSMGSTTKAPPIKSQAELISGTGLFVNLKP
jgi:hypothetical protein